MIGKVLLFGAAVLCGNPDGAISRQAAYLAVCFAGFLFPHPVFQCSGIYLWNYPMPIMLAVMGFVLLLLPGKAYGIAAMAAGGMTIMFCLGVGNIVTLTYTQSTVPVEMLGSVSALSTAVATGTVPVGQVLFGQLMGSGLKSGVILLLCAVVALFVSLYVRMNVNRRNTCDMKSETGCAQTGN